MAENTVVVIGAGLAGCEAAWQAAKLGVKVELYEMKPKKYSPAHHSEGFAELVCSNSLRSNQTDNAVGLLKAELSALGSLIMEAAYATEVPAGSALAVNRDEFQTPKEFNDFNNSSENSVSSCRLIPFPLKIRRKSGKNSVGGA
jgi:methylenetetrahydrofolate--tRNA-(uracil-5-)-methyltransferase